MYSNFFKPPVDEFGNPVKRTKDKYPYSYDGFVIYKNPDLKGKATVYSDRLHRENPAKYRRLCEEHFNSISDYWSNREPKKIEAFLREFLEDSKLKLQLVMEYCNHSSGYPLWRFDLC